MSGEILVGGTAYEVTGGKTLVGGTAYNISAGKTLVGGTAYDISFAQREQTFPALMAAATLDDLKGRNASSSAAISITLPSAGTYYVMSFCKGYMSINKVIFDGSTSTWTQVGGNPIHSGTTAYGFIYCNGATVYYSRDENSSQNVYGGAVARVSFGEYTESEVDTIVAAATFRNLAGANASRSSYMSCSPFTGYLFVACSDKLVFDSVSAADNTFTAIFSNYSTNPSLLYYSTSEYYYSANGSRITSIYGGSMIQVS